MMTNKETETRKLNGLLKATGGNMDRGIDFAF
jgi:hypothetical protein